MLACAFDTAASRSLPKYVVYSLSHLCTLRCLYLYMRLPLCYPLIISSSSLLGQIIPPLSRVSTLDIGVCSGPTCLPTCSLALHVPRTEHTRVSLCLVPPTQARSADTRAKLHLYNHFAPSPALPEVYSRSLSFPYRKQHMPESLLVGPASASTL